MKMNAGIQEATTMNNLTGTMNKRYCLNCNSTSTYVKKDGIANWFKYKAGHICKKCYDKLIGHPKWTRRRIKFKGKSITLKENPRKGICSKCAKEGITHMHHIEYHEDDPLTGTIELCVNCHRRMHTENENRDHYE